MSVALCLGLGANLGDPLASFAWALGQLAERVGTLGAVSSAYRTAALVPEGSLPGPDYWNAACVVRTELSAAEVLLRLLALESERGRVRRERWAARCLDLDLLLYGTATVDLPGLRVPHPALAARSFVLRPLAEIAADWRVPGHDATVAQLLARLPDPNAGILEVRTHWRAAESSAGAAAKRPS